jgi:hypothetical protein
MELLFRFKEMRYEETLEVMEQRKWQRVKWVWGIKFPYTLDTCIALLMFAEVTLHLNQNFHMAVFAFQKSEKALLYGIFQTYLLCYHSCWFQVA